MLKRLAAAAHFLRAFAIIGVHWVYATTSEVEGAYIRLKDEDPDLLLSSTCRKQRQSCPCRRPMTAAGVRSGSGSHRTGSWAAAAEASPGIIGPQRRRTAELSKKTTWRCRRDPWRPATALLASQKCETLSMSSILAMTRRFTEDLHLHHVLRPREASPFSTKNAMPLHPMDVDISGLRPRIFKRSCATVARCHGEVFRRRFHKVSAIILRDRNAQRFRMKLKSLIKSYSR